MNAQIQAVFRRRKLTYTLLIAAVVGIYFFASAITKFHLTEGVLSFPKAFVWIGENLIPDELAIRRFPKILDKLLETALCGGHCHCCYRSVLHRLMPSGAGTEKSRSGQSTGVQSS